MGKGRRATNKPMKLAARSKLLKKNKNNERAYMAKHKALDAKTKAARIAKHMACSSIPYTKDHAILLVGEGNFSFSCALMELFGTAENIVATCYDSMETLCTKYDEAAGNVIALEDAGATVLMNVDATDLESTPELKGKVFDRIVFNFPHTGSGIKDTQLNIEGNQRLISRFIASAIGLMRKGGSTTQASQVHVTCKKGEPYTSWNVSKLMKQEEALDFHSGLPFYLSKYPGYEHRRTLGYKEGLTSGDNVDILKGATTYISILHREVDPKTLSTADKRHQKMAANKGKAKYISS